MCNLTVHTATYNRDYILGQAYESLRAQTNKNFCWIITDDGSTDKTENMVKEWMKNDNGFEIIYNKLNHVGIPRALNSGVALTKTEWFMMLDSDDYILPNTVEQIYSWLDEIKDKKNIGGIGFARCQPNGEFMKKQTPIIDPKVGYVDATHLERAKYNLDMDMCEVHRTELFRKFPFQYWEDEKYAPEQLSFYNMALAGWKLRWRADKLYVCDYLPDGQTRDNKIVKNNPMGFAMMYNQNLIFHKSLKERINDASQMTALCSYAGHMDYLKQSNSKLATVLSLPLGIALGMRRKKQFKNL